jgi:hypothetical protein
VKTNLLVSTLLVSASLILGSLPAAADPFFFSTGGPNNAMGAATRTSAGAVSEIETGDDFVLTKQTTLNSATFTGLIPTGNSANGVTVEIYRVFPLDSNSVRTPNVPTRNNSPSDVAFDSRAAGAGLTFSTAILAPSFTVLNSVQPGGIHPSPGQHTGGDGPLTGQEVQFTVNFTTAFNLPAGHYFFVPQVDLSDPHNGAFEWESAERPIVSGTPFPPGFTDLQAWTRDEFLDPDWLRIGTDIVGGNFPPTFNMAFTLDGVTSVPEPSTWAMMLIGLAGLGFAGMRRSRRQVA